MRRTAVWRNAVAMLMGAALSGCVGFQGGPETGGGPQAPHWGRSYGPPSVPGVKGPYGENVAMAAPYDSAPPPNAYMARQMMNQNMPMTAVQMNNGGMPGMMPGMPPNGVMSPTSMPRGPMLSPPGVPFAPGVPTGMGAPPGGPGLMPTGGGMPGMPGAGMPGTGMPGTMPMGGGVINANIPPGMMPPGGIMQAQANAAAGIHFAGQRTQIRFVRPSGMEVSWFTQGADGKPMYSTNPVKAPGRYNFPQAAIYRLKLSNIDALPGMDIYPTMEVVPCNPKTEAFLAHSAVPIEFTNDDWKQIKEGNYLVKVIYLPDPQFQDVAGTGTDEIISTRLEPGADPIQEALRRGSILVVLRMGNVDQEAPNTPPLNSAPPMVGQSGPGMPPPPTNPGLKPPPLPPQMTSTPRPIANALSVSNPKTPAPIAPGVSSTAKFQDAPQHVVVTPVQPTPTPEANSISPALPTTPAPVPQTSSPVLPQVAPPGETGPGLSDMLPPPPPPPPPPIP